MNLTRTLLAVSSMIVISAPARADDTLTHVSGATIEVVVQARNADGTWRTVCRGTCDERLPSDGVYRIDGPGLRASKPFQVEGPNAWLGVTTGSWAGFAGGLTLTILGLPATGFGGLGLMVDGLAHAYCGGTCSGGDNLLLPSVLLLIGGMVMSITGVATIAANRRTRVSGAATARVATWRETTPARNVGAVGLPLITGTF